MTEMTFTPTSEGDKTAEELYAERSKRMQDALELRQPDRIPIQLGFGYMLAEMGGITRQEQHENGEKEQELLEQASLYFQPDAAMGLFNNPGAALAVGDRMTRFPGHGLPENGSFQFVEGEYMLAEDYDAFIDDPADWSIRKYWPRVFSKLGGLAMLPPLGLAAFGTYSLFQLGILKAPPVAQAFRALADAVEAQAAADARMIGSSQRMAALGFIPPLFAGSLIEAPFDFMSDTLRGMRGIMLDMHRRPEKLLTAMEKCLRFQLEHAINFRRATGMKMCFIPLHRGSDGFMSLPQFEKFYWPTFKEMVETLVDNDIIPFVFYEGEWDQRLNHLAQLPQGKTSGLFQFSDIFKVKEVLGGKMCIAGGMRNSLLQAGTPKEVREWTKKLCEVVGKDGGFVMTTGIGEMEGCKPELVKEWVDATKEYGSY
jgi:uroporphyrinogen-III decarboxylase